MAAPSSDKAAMRQTIRALRAAGWQLDFVDNGEEEILATTEDAALDDLTSVDVSWLHVKRTESNGLVTDTGYVFFVMGNSPEEVITDHTTNLSSVLDPLTQSWWS